MSATASASGSFGSPHLRWGWLLALGIALIILGTIALGDTLLVTLVSVLLLGWLLIGSAIIHIVHLCRHTEERSFWNFVTIILDLLAGFFLMVNPAFGALSLTLVLAAFFLAGGITRLIAAASKGAPDKFWAVLGGIISILLGILLFVHWPVSGLWFIGLAIGIELIFRGWVWITIAFALRSRLLRRAPA
jgi:uncharacterized membrane protein HdeD (DUF308 family)